MKTSKNVNKELKIANEKAALQRRIEDIACGAGVDMDYIEEDNLILVFDCSSFGRFIKALKDTFMTKEKFEDGTGVNNIHLFSEICFGEYTTINNLTEFLYSGEVRA